MVLKNSIEFYAIMSKFEMFDDIELDKDDELYKCFACVSMIEHLEEQSLLTFKQVASLECKLLKRAYSIYVKDKSKYQRFINQMAGKNW